MGNYLPAKLPRVLRRPAGPRRRPDRLRGPVHDPDRRRHPGRRARHPPHLLRVHPRGPGDAESPETVEATDLIQGRRYFILPTTSGGLYRYHIHDLVECVGFEGKAPLLVFLNKGAHFSSLTGEKLSEFQVVHAVGAAQREIGLRLTSFLLLPTWGDPPRYNLLVEEGEVEPGPAADRFAGAVEAALSRENLEYENRRTTQRLGPLRVRRIARGGWIDFQRRRLARNGGTVEQYKQPCLLADLEAIDGFTMVGETA